MSSKKETLLVLDVDELLVHGSSSPLADRLPDYCFSGSGETFHFYKRPHLDHFLTTTAELYQLALWSAATSDVLMNNRWCLLPPHVQPAFVWARERCTARRSQENENRWHVNNVHYVKDLKKVKKLGYDLKRTLIVEDTPANCSRNYGNAVYVKPYFGDADDDELLHLTSYLQQLFLEPDFRVVEKRGWRSRFGHNQ